jgi:hypothetical protein
MKKILLILLILNISLKSVLGQCGEGILLKKDSRDWVKTYDNLSKKYKSKPEPAISSLKAFFYDGEKRRDCISLVNLQLLNKKMLEVFAKTKSDEEINKFKVAITSIANANVPGSKTENVVKPVVAGKTTATTTKSDTAPKVETDSNASISSLKEKQEALEGEKTSLQNDIERLKSGQNLWRGLFLGLLALSILVVGWLVWYYFPKQLKANDESSHSFRQEQKVFYEGKIKELAGKIKESESGSKNTFREPKPFAETPKTIVEKAIEPAKAIVPEPPKPQEKLKQFYLSSPALSADGKGVFDGSETYNANSINSLYVFNLLNDNSAEFKFFNIPTTVQDAIRLPDRYLLYACEYSGVNSNATKIITTKAGKAVKEGNNWKITQKAEIRFE